MITVEGSHRVVQGILDWLEFANPRGEMEPTGLRIKKPNVSSQNYIHWTIDAVATMAALLEPLGLPGMPMLSTRRALPGSYFSTYREICRFKYFSCRPSSTASSGYNGTTGPDSCHGRSPGEGVASPASSWVGGYLDRHADSSDGDYVCLCWSEILCKTDHKASFCCR